MKHHTLDDWQRLRILQLAQAGVGTDVIAVRLGLARSTVYAVISKRK